MPTVTEDCKRRCSESLVYADTTGYAAVTLKKGRVAGGDVDVFACGVMCHRVFTVGSGGELDGIG